MKTAIILGATGMIGQKVLNLLLNDNRYSTIYAYTRQPLKEQSEKLINIVTDFSNMSQLSFPEIVDSLFSCLGTTKKKTPNMDRYRFTEISIPQYFLEVGRNKGLKTVHFISSIGANKDSKNFYLKIKGEAEELFREAKIDTVNIYQPGFLIGKREIYSPGEKMIQKIAKLLDIFCVGKGKKYHSITSTHLAKSMIMVDDTEVNGSKIYSYKDLEQYM